MGSRAGFLFTRIFIIITLINFAYGLCDKANAQTIPGTIGCHQFTFFAVSAPVALTQFIPATAGKRIGLCGYTFIFSDPKGPSIQFQYGTGTNCATGTTVFSPVIYIDNGVAMVNRGPVVTEVTPYNQALCYVATGSTGITVTVIVYYTYF